MNKRDAPSLRSRAIPCMRASFSPISPLPPSRSSREHPRYFRRTPGNTALADLLGFSSCPHTRGFWFGPEVLAGFAHPLSTSPLCLAPTAVISPFTLLTPKSSDSRCRVSVTPGRDRSTFLLHLLFPQMQLTRRQIKYPPQRHRSSVMFVRCATVEWMALLRALCQLPLASCRHLIAFNSNTSCRREM